MNNKQSRPSSGEQQRPAVSDAELRLWHHRIQVGLRAKANIRLIFEQALAAQAKQIVVPLKPTTETVPSEPVTPKNNVISMQNFRDKEPPIDNTPPDISLNEEEKQLREIDEAQSKVKKAFDDMGIAA